MKFRTSTQNMISLIIFIVICIIIYIFKLATKQEFVEFERIITAIAVSSFIFTVSNLQQLSYKFENELYQLSLDVQQELIYKEKQFLKDFSNGEYLKNNESLKLNYEKLRKLNNDLEISTNEYKAKADKNSKKYYIICSMLNVVAFEMLLLIIVFDKVYVFFQMSADIYTLLAFALLLFSMLSEEIEKEIIEMKKTNLSKQIKSIIDDMEKMSMKSIKK